MKHARPATALTPLTVSLAKLPLYSTRSLTILADHAQPENTQAQAHAQAAMPSAPLAHPEATAFQLMAACAKLRPTW